MSKPKWGWKVEYWDDGKGYGSTLFLSSEDAWKSGVKWSTGIDKRVFTICGIALRSEEEEKF